MRNKLRTKTEKKFGVKGKHSAADRQLLILCETYRRNGTKRKAKLSNPPARNK